MKNLFHVKRNCFFTATHVHFERLSERHFHYYDSDLESDSTNVHIENLR
jgi:hypothetical protein